MRLLYVVQRYGHDVAGGAELACREFATRMAARGHDVHVVTSCARDYLGWDNVYAPGVEMLNGVRVTRLPVGRRRDYSVFAGVDYRVARSQRRTAHHVQTEWMRLQGPYIPELPTWIAERASSFDVVIFYTYLYFTTWAGLRAAAGLVPTVLHPAAHDEPPLTVELFDEIFRLADGFAYHTEEEGDVVHARFAIDRPETVVGLGVDFVGPADAALFRKRHLGDARPYLLFVGRIEPSKATDELFDLFTRYKEKHPGPLALVLAGAPVRPPPPHPDVITTGFIEEDVKRSAMAGAVALVQPSYFESYSLVLSEAWSLSRPALVQRMSTVLAGQARRSGGAITYHGFSEFEAGVDALVGDESTRQRLGEAGRSYVEQRYDWGRILERYDRFLSLVASRRLAAR